MQNQFKKRISKEEALVRAMKFCAYRERCVAETETKLLSWGLSQTDCDWVIDDLVEQNFINEDRYLLSYVRGKFNQNKWGVMKIRMALRQQRFSDERIDVALKKIDRKEYEKTASALVKRKKEELQKLEPAALRSKIYYYMMSKGFEADLIIDLIKRT